MDTLSYFDLSEPPFKTGPDPRYLYLSDQVKEAIGRCEYMASERVGPVYFYGPIGSGKTTILKRLYERLSSNKSYHIAFLLSLPNLKSANTFLRNVMEEFGVKTERSYDRSMKNFEEFLVTENDEGITPVLLMDEAQYLSKDMLKTIHHFLNFESPTLKFLQIVLAGQEELGMNMLKMPELKSRMFPISFSAMSIQDLIEMIRYRWRTAGGKDDPPFADEEAYKMLYACSKGLPRDAVKICDELLRYLQDENLRKADASQVERIAKELSYFNDQ